MNEFDREIILINNDNFKKIQSANVIVFGVGGVGGYVCEFLVRAGISNLTIVDYDKIDVTNINRQIIANNNTIGKEKIETLKERLQGINNNIKIFAIKSKLTVDNINSYNLENYDYVIDCIDDVDAKFNLVKYCYFNKINCISSLGAGNKYCVPSYVVSDIFKTNYDAIGKKLRKYCRENCIKKHNVVYSNVETVKVQGGIIGSISYHPPACASVLSGFVINELIKENKNERD